MRDTKSLLLLLVSLLLVLVSFVLIWTWGYNFYTRNESPKTTVVVAAVDSAAIANRVKDSLQKLYTATLDELDIQLNSTLSHSDSLKNELDVKLAEFYRLRTEIVTLLKNRSTNSNNNFAVARQKINELQSKVDDLKEKNQVVDSENKKLNEVLDQISKNDRPVDNRAANSNKAGGADRTAGAFPLFTASDLRLAAVSNEDDKETETTLAEKTDKFNGSFTVTNFNSQLTNAEMMVIVLKPDGRVLKGSGWDSGTFNTVDGRKIYSYKFNFSYARGEAKRLLFSLKGSSLIRGNYTMEVYQNGQMIARTVKTLS